MTGDVTQGVLINPFSSVHHNVIGYSARLYIYSTTIHESVFVLVMADYNRIINSQYKVKRMYLSSDLKIPTAPKGSRVEFLLYFYSCASPCLEINNSPSLSSLSRLREFRSSFIIFLTISARVILPISLLLVARTSYPAPYAHLSSRRHFSLIIPRLFCYPL